MIAHLYIIIQVSGFVEISVKIALSRRLQFHRKGFDSLDAENPDVVDPQLFIGDRSMLA